MSADILVSDSALANGLTGFIRQPQLLEIVPMSPATLWRAVQDGSFPAPVKLTSRCTAWRLEDIKAWCASRAPKPHRGQGSKVESRA